MSKLILITGGARSGKSSYALELAESLSEKRLFVATCPTIDPEMSERVRRHQEEREGRGWQTIETELDLKDLLSNMGTKYDVILIDCITLWVNNLLFDAEKKGVVVTDQIVGDFCREWIETTRNQQNVVICVTNEVGLGIVPENPLARKYRDLVGTANQMIGKAADDVALVSCGIPLYIKQNHK
ncbi:MAG: bifunctional adenosylcobinamide kinase/adenosylcobinamide-phosphate guanylyltransferase [Proteobacteria bacterium]|nr:bifunctional adenosylcobinamide kinase/adenosylcobinamide-phosphate guanylyltransferase [Pseudomonadota bacterium]